MANIVLVENSSRYGNICVLYALTTVQRKGPDDYFELPANYGAVLVMDILVRTVGVVQTAATDLVYKGVHAQLNDVGLSKVVADFGNAPWLVTKAGAAPSAYLRPEQTPIWTPSEVMFLEGGEVDTNAAPGPVWSVVITVACLRKQGGLQ